ncbi:MAG: CinA family protein [Candidatus Bathyarchaeia archaeon]
MRKEERIGKILKERGLSLACAESITGGLISDRITDVPGSSSYFKGSIVCYSVQAKMDLLSIPEHLIREKGVISAEVAERMAEGVRETMGSDIGLSTTGLAGPEGSEGKPVGTVFVGLSAPGHTLVRTLSLQGDRRTIKEAASEAALDLLISFLEESHEGLSCF